MNWIGVNSFRRGGLSAAAHHSADMSGGGGAAGKAVAYLAHGQRVRFLYKTILKLHRGLPPELAYMGNSYVKDEFKRHKAVTPENAVTFMEEWTVSIEL